MRANILAVLGAALCISVYIDAGAAVKSEATHRTHAVRQGTAQLATHSALPCAAPLTRAECDARAWAACETDARSRTTNPGAAIRSFTMKTGGGLTIGTAPTREQCEATVYNRLKTEGTTRESGGNVNSCAAVTKYSTAAAVPTCLSTTSFIFSYTVNATCAPIAGPNPRPMTCPAGMLGAWSQTGTKTPPTCAEVWTPATAPAGDCFTLDRSATVTWTPPTRNTDGTTLTNLAGFRVAYGTNSSALASTVQIANPGVARYIFTNLDPGTWFFSARAYTSSGTESANSNQATKTVR